MPPVPTMATTQQLVGRWCLVGSRGFDEHMKEVGVGMALWKMGVMAKPNCILTFDGRNLTVKTERTLKTTQFSCNLGQKFEETTADVRKTDHLQLYKWRIGSTSGVGWEEKHNHKKAGRWANGGGMHHEECHLYSDL